VQIENSVEAIWKRRRIFPAIGKLYFVFPLPHLQCVWALCFLLGLSPVSSLRGFQLTQPYTVPLRGCRGPADREPTSEIINIKLPGKRK